MEAAASTPLTGTTGSALGRNSDRHSLRRQPLITVAAAATAGIFAAQTVAQALWAAAAITAILIGWWCCRRHRRWGWLAATGCVALAFGLRTELGERSFRSASIAALATTDWQPCVLRGTVVGPVERRPDRLARLRGAKPADAWQSVFGLRLTALRVGSQWRPTTGGARVIVSGDATRLLPGDHLQILGQIQSIAPPSNPGDLDLRPIYRARRQQIRLLVDSPDHISAQPPPSWTPARPLADFAAAGEQALLRHLGQRRAPLAAALVLGRREAVDESEREKLLQTGTAHLLSVSGLHLGLVALAVSWLVVLLGLPRRQQILIILAGCVLYAALTGGRPPVLRAALLIATVLAGLWLGRPIHPLGALALAAVVLLTLNPANLTQVGVHLSFVAVGTLLLVGRYASAASSAIPPDPLDRLLDSRLGPFRRRSSALLGRLRLAVFFSFWVWAITAPLVWYQFHIVSPISIIANVVLGIPLVVSLISGLLTVTVAGLWDPLAAVLGFVCGQGLDLMTYLIDRLAVVPYGHCWLPAPPAGWVMVFYGVTIGGLLLSERYPRGRLTIAWLAIWCVGSLWLISHRSLPPADAVEATFVDVGHGTAILVRHPIGGTWLYDCGRLGDPAQSSRPIEAVLWHAGVRRLDGVILSHADADHYNALPALLRRFSIARIVTPPGLLDTDEPGLAEVRRAIRAAGVRVTRRVAGDALADGDGAAWAQVLHPPPRRLPGNDNANSLVLRIDYGGRSLLLPGDLEHRGTEALLRTERPIAGGILMAPHHGSLQQDLRPLLDWCRPAEIIVSGSRRADRPEVRQALAQKGSRVYLTARDGAIRVRIDRQGEIRIDRYLQEPW